MSGAPDEFQEEKPAAERSSEERERLEPASPSSVVAAYFDEREQAEMALGDLERSGFPANTIGVAFPQNGRSRSSRRARGANSRKRRVLVPAGPTTGFPGWTMGMAPWVISGIGPLVVQGSLSLARRKDRPGDLRALTGALSLREEATEQLRNAFERRAVLVTVEAAEKEVIATHILERNGGHSLPRKQ